MYFYNGLRDVFGMRFDFMVGTVSLLPDPAIYLAEHVVVMDEQRGSRKSFRILKASIYVVHSYRENSPLSLLVCIVCIADHDPWFSFTFSSYLLSSQQSVYR